MPRIIKKCPYCGVTAREKSHFDTKSARIISLTCGHAVAEDLVSIGDYSEMSNLIGDKPYPFQVEGCKFLEETANLRGLLTYQQGLGKTIMACMIAKAHPEIRPIITFCKATLKPQWFKQFYYWTGEPSQTIDSSKEEPLPEIGHYIISYDTANRLKWLPDLKKKLVIIDEVQNIKNHDAQRTNAVRKACANAEFIIGLSGTPIKNNAGEFFPILNLLRAEMFPNLNDFYWNHLASKHSQYGGSRVIGLRRPEEFKSKTSTFILGKSREECLPDLPKVQRINHFCDLGSYVEAYEKVFNEFAHIYDKLEDPTKAFSSGSQIIGLMQKLKHIAGLSKINSITEYVEEHLMTTMGEKASDQKIAIFVHHQDVMQMLKDSLTKIADPFESNPPLIIDSSIKPELRYAVVEKFAKDPKNKMVLATTLVAGEGLDGLQCAHKLVLGEREWNSVNEEQAEGRFTRPGSEADYVEVCYMIAEQTIDEQIGELVEKKRAVVEEIMKGKEVNFTESKFMTELGDLLRNKGRKIWRV